MATYTSREVVSRRREWIVPAEQPWGAPYVELYRALHVAETSYREAHQVPDNVSLPDDALRVTTTEDAVVISYTVEEVER
jgi:hypothetical protein